MEQESPKKERAVSRKFVLALLDKRQVKHFLGGNGTQNDEIAWIRPFIRQPLRYSKRFSGIEGDGDRPYYVVNLSERQSTLREAERLTKFFFGHSYGEGEGGSENEISGEEWRDLDDSESYHASAVIFPIEDKPNFALAYVLGNWQNMISRESIDRDFGVRTAASEGMSEVTEGVPLETIKSATMGCFRDENITLHFTKQRGALGRFTEVNSGPEGCSLEGLRLKPKKDLNSRLVEGKNTFSFFLYLPKKSTTMQYIEYLRKEAFKYYHIYKDFPVAKDFEEYFDSQVDPRSETAHKLINNLDANWDTYVKRNIITESVNVWSVIGRLPRKKQCEEKQCLKNAIRKGKSSAIVHIGIDKIRLLHLIRVSYVYLHESGKFYRMEEGQWYEMHSSLIKTMEKAISRHIIPREDLSLISAESSTQEEGKYNVMAVDKINARGQSEKISALLLDKQNVELRWRNKFELADILLTTKGNKENKQCFLIHVKKHTADSLAHHCHQLTRSANFMSDNLDRTPVATSFEKCFIIRWYDDLIDKPEKKERSIFFQKKSAKNKAIIPTLSAINEMIDLYVKSKGRNKAEIDEILEIKEIIGRDDWKEIIEKMCKYGDAFYLWLDCMVDFISAPKFPTPTKTLHFEKMRNTLEEYIDQLEEHDMFTTWTEGILPREKKNKITFVLGIITNTPCDRYMIDNRVLLIHEAMNAVQKYKFQFKITFIPVLEEGKRQTRKKVGKPIGIGKPKKPEKFSDGKGKRKLVEAASTSGESGVQSGKRRRVHKLALPTEKENPALKGKVPTRRAQRHCGLQGRTTATTDEVTLIPEAGNKTANHVQKTRRTGVRTANCANGSEDLANAEENVGKIVKKSAGPSRKRAAAQGTSPVSKSRPKREKQVKTLEGCPRMKRWLETGRLG